MRYTSICRICVISLFCIFFSLQSFSQQSHFIYLQTDNQQAFYIKYNNRIYSSSATGYLILSKLKDGPVEFSVGFPRSNQPEQKFLCTIDNADKGFLLKNFSEKGWGLYDLQSSVVVYAGAGTEIKTNNTAVTTVPPVTDDPFANMLSKVTQDSTVKNVTLRKEEKVIVDTPKPPVVTTPVVIKLQPKDTAQAQVVQQPAKVTEAPVMEPIWIAPAKSTVQQLRKFDSREGIDFVFEISNTDGIRDTVRLFIAKDSIISEGIQPAGSNTEVKADTDRIIKENKKESVTEPILIQEEKKEPLVESVLKKEEPKKENVKLSGATEQKTEAKALPNSNCTSVATEEDFMKLRRKMASESKDEAMINVAKKVFHIKCFSTAQIKNLAVLFLNDEGRYRFYDAAMLYITDFSNFKNLGETIQDDYYKKRFIALLPNQ